MTSRRISRAVKAILILSAMLFAPIGAPYQAAAQAVPAFARIVIVVEENHAYSSIIGNPSAPYLNWIAANGALMTRSYAVTHPSEPNYLALFAGDTFGLGSDACPMTIGAAPNLASELLAAGGAFGGFAEDLPAVGSPVCSAAKYARKHAPWVNFTNVPAAASMPFTSFQAVTDPAALPTVSFVIPNLDNDMHDGSIAQADNWLSTNLSRYAAWAKANNSLLIVTWDEDDDSSDNHIPTIVYGAHVNTGAYAEPISHYSVLSTVQQIYGLPKTGHAAQSPPISDIWVG